MERNFPETSRVKGTVPARTAMNLPFVEGVSACMQGLERVIREIADSSVPVLLSGESGAGKRVTAERIHQVSSKRQQRFDTIPCCGFDQQWFSELTQNEGEMRLGTVYLEEVADLSQDAQQQLLECLPRLEVNGNGGSKGVRLISGTTKDLEGEIRAGRFREDLYYRLSVINLRIPPLRQRREDIPLLVNFFLEKYAADFRRPVPVLSAETHRLFLEYNWPGNLRELEDAAKAFVILGDEGLAMGGLRSLLKPEHKNGDRLSLKEAARAASREAEKELILKVLTRTRWNRRRAAQELQISYKALLYKLKQIGYGEYGTT
jgi:two-component system, NtrC family, response regulator AtoC